MARIVLPALALLICVLSGGLHPVQAAPSYDYTLVYYYFDG